MKVAMIVLGVLLLVLLGTFGWVKGIYNGLVVGDEGVHASWAQVENQLQRRYDLIPNLVETVKGYASHERETLQAVTEARSKVAGAGTIPEKIEANNQLTSALSRLMVVVERYPDLKASQNFRRLQDELAGTENRIAVERRRYNESVQSYNIMVRKFPNTVLAGMFGFERAELFEADAAAQSAPKVDFGSGTGTDG